MKPTDEIERLARKTQFEPAAATDRRILSAAEAALDRRAATPNAAPKRSMWLSIVKLSAAAVVTIAVALVVNAFLSTSHVAWASVLDRVYDQNSFRCHSANQEVEVDANGTSHSTEREGILSIAKDYGMVYEASLDGKPGGRSYVLFGSNEDISVDYRTRQYWRSRAPKGGTWEDFAERGDPRRLVAKVLEGQYTKLGRKIVDGRTVEGIENSDLKTVYGDTPLPPDGTPFVLRLWIDVKTQLPVRLESTLGPFKNGGVTLTKTGVSDQFQWGVEFPRDFFTPRITEGFMAMTSTKPDETAFVTAMRWWAKSHGGSYPSGLDPLSFWQGIKDPNHPLTVIQVRRLPTGQYRQDTNMDARGFYEMLVQDGNSPVYYGDHVGPADSNAILMYWHLLGTQYRVVWGDLRLETMQANDMVRFLRRVGDEDAWTAGMARGHMAYRHSRPDDRGVVWVGIQRTWTEASGDFAIPAPPADSNETWLACAFGPPQTQTGRALLLRASDRDKDLTIVLEPLCTVKGRIIDSAGQPRQSAAMWLFGHAGDRTDSLSMLHYPDNLEPDGSFEIRGVPTGAALDFVAMVGSGGRTRVAIGELTPGQTRDLGTIVLDDVKQDK